MKLLVEKGAEMESMTSAESLAVDFLGYDNVVVVVVRVAIASWLSKALRGN